MINVRVDCTTRGRGGTHFEGSLQFGRTMEPCRESLHSSVPQILLCPPSSAIVIILRTAPGPSPIPPVTSPKLGNMFSYNSWAVGWRRGGQQAGRSSPPAKMSSAHLFRLHTCLEVSSRRQSSIPCISLPTWFYLLLRNTDCRLEKAVISGRLWYPACQQASQDLPSDLPVSFASPQQYIAAYEALIFEEAREAVLHCKMDRFSHQTQASILG